VAEYDVIVVGLGAMGSAAAYQLARRGKRVLGLEAFHPGHTLGSSHGETRIIRMAYFEHPDYVPLLRRAYELWAETERESQTELQRLTGGLYVGLPDSELVAGSLLSARTYGLPHSLLTAEEIRSRFPSLQPGQEEVGVFEDQAGILFPERCIQAHLGLAQAAGATLQFSERVLSVSADAVRTTEATYSAGRVVVTAGAWMGKLLPTLDGVVVAERIPLFWFEPLSELGPLPILIWQAAQLGDFYAVPHVGWPGVKLGKHHSDQACDPDSVNREITEADERPMRAFLDRHIPKLSGKVADARVCLYENSPDMHFIIDVTDDGIVFAGGFSGHGFKFASVVGEVLADLATTGRTTPAADFLRLKRLSHALQSQR
jgi:sarcosine oxidase